MICDECTHKEVCSIKEKCNALEEEINGNYIEEALRITVACKYRSVSQCGIRTIVAPNFPTKSTNPLRDSEWDRRITYTY